MIRIVKPKLKHAAMLHKVARQADRSECAKLSSESIRHAVERSIRTSSIAWSAFADKEIIACFGVVCASATGGIGNVWCLTGNGVDNNKRAFYRGSKIFLKEMLRYYPTLIAVVHKEHEKAIKWLKSIGFDLTGPFEDAQFGDGFYHAIIRREA